MKVFTLPDARELNVLLSGDHAFVAEFEERLLDANIKYTIMPQMDEIDELDLEVSMLDPEFMAPDPDIDIDFPPFTRTVFDDIRSNVDAFTHIVDLSVRYPNENKTNLEFAALHNPNATVICNVLATTATEIGYLSEVEQRIIGVTLAPSIIANATVVDYAGGLNTTREHVDRAAALLRAVGYTPELVEDRVALVQMRILVMLINEAAFAVMEGVASPADIDNAMKLGVNYPKGLLAWADEIGIAIVTITLDCLHREYLQERYRPCILLKQYMRAGWNGKSAGRGFYKYQ